jgi:hypothetical protein
MHYRNMKAERLPLIMVVTAAILVTPSILTSPVLAQVPPAGTAGGTTDTEEDNQETTDGGTAGTTADDESPGDMYEEFQSCLSEAEGTENFADEQEIRGCFIEAGYIQGTDDDNEDEDDNEETN